MTHQGTSTLNKFDIRTLYLDFQVESKQLSDLDLVPKNEDIVNLVNNRETFSERNFWQLLFLPKCFWDV